MFTTEEIELLAGILQRAPVSRIEVLWVNSLLNRLRQVASKNLEKAISEQGTEVTPYTEKEG